MAKTTITKLEKQIKELEKKSDALLDQASKFSNKAEELEDKSSDIDDKIGELEDKIAGIRNIQHRENLETMVKAVQKQGKKNLTKEQAKLIEWAVKQSVRD